MISKKAKEKVDAFEEIVLEKGIPRKFFLSYRQGKLKVALKKNEAAIAKNTCIGLLSGAFSLHPGKKSSFIVAQGSKGTLFFDASQEENFLSSLPYQEPKSNLCIHFVWDEEEEYIAPLVFTSRKIEPGDPLIVSPFSSLSL
jgi:hypothetical protein